MKTLKAVDVSNDNFAPFGSVIKVTGALKSDAQNEIQTYYGKLAIMNESGIQLGICVAKNRPYEVTQMEQHVETKELLAALKGSFVTPVAPSKMVDGKQVPDLDKAIAVKVNQGEGVVFDVGIWHWTPYAITETCDVLVGFKTDTPQNDFIAERTEDRILIEL